MQKLKILLTTIVFLTGIFFLPQIVFGHTELDKNKEFEAYYSSSYPGILASWYSARYDSESNNFNITQWSVGGPVETSQVLINDDEENKLRESIEPLAGSNFTEHTCLTAFCYEHGLGIKISNQTSNLLWTDNTVPILNTLYGYGNWLEQVPSSNPIDMPPFFPNPPSQSPQSDTYFAIDYKKSLGGVVPGQFIHIKYNSSNNVYSIEDEKGETDKMELNSFNKLFIRGILLENDLMKIDFHNNQCQLANCDVVTLTVTEGTKSNTITYTDQSNIVLNEIENVKDTILTMTNTSSVNLR